MCPATPHMSLIFPYMSRICPNMPLVCPVCVLSRCTPLALRDAWGANSLCQVSVHPVLLSLCTPHMSLICPNMSRICPNNSLCQVSVHPALLSLPGRDTWEALLSGRHTTAPCKRSPTKQQSETLHTQTPKKKICGNCLSSCSVSIAFVCTCVGVGWGGGGGACVLVRRLTF